MSEIETADEGHSVTHYVRRLGSGDPEAARGLWDRYGPRLVEMARRRFGRSLGQAEDGEDLAQSVFVAVWRGAESGRLDDVGDRDAFWYLLLAVTRNKALNRIEARNCLKRAGTTFSLSDFDAAGDEPAARSLAGGPAPPPADLAAMLAEEHERLLAALGDGVLRSIAVWKFEGESNEEIASRLDVSVRTVNRKVALIRERWSGEVAP